jgi:cobyric acid synthase
MIDELVVIPQEKSSLSDLKVLRGKAFANKLEKDFTDK